MIMAIEDAFFNADKAFDTNAARKTCFNHGLIPNMAKNKRNWKGKKRGWKRLFDAEVYKRRFASECTFAWVDKFRAGSSDVMLTFGVGITLPLQ